MAKIDVKAEGEEVVVGIGGDRETRLTIEEAEQFQDDLIDALEEARREEEDRKADEELSWERRRNGKRRRITGEGRMLEPGQSYIFYLHLVPTGEDWITYICLGSGGLTDCEWLIAVEPW